MRSLPRLAWLRYPALAAMLLLSFAPSVSRLLAAPGSSSGWAQLCTMSGLKQVWLDAATLPSSDPHDDGDCGYCPLLGAMLGAALVLLLVAAERRMPSAMAVCVSPAIADRIRGSLGARGPPALVRL